MKAEALPLLYAFQIIVKRISALDAVDLALAKLIDVVETSHVSFFIDQDQSWVGKAAFQSGIVDVLAGERIGLKVLNPGPGYIDVPPGTGQSPAVVGVGILPDVEGYDINAGILLL